MDKKKIIAIIVAAVLAVVLVVVGIILVVQNVGGDSSKKDNSDKTSTSQKADDNDSSKGDNGDEDGDDDSKNDVSAAAGKTVTVPVTLKSNPGINACQLSFEYDTKALTLLSIENGDILDEYESYGDMVLVYSSGLENIKETGTLVTLEFSVKDSAESGTYEIKLGSDTMIVNADEKDVDPEISIGKITVE